MFDVEGFEYNSPEEVREEVLSENYQARLNNTASTPVAVKASPLNTTLVRLGEVAVYQLDILCRNAPSLQATQDALRANKVQANRQLLVDLAVNEGDLVRVRQGEGEAVLPIVLDDALPDNVIRVAAANTLTSALAGMFGAISIEKA
jgi:NADH-quinone oxidoreductase subunit G